MNKKLNKTQSFLGVCPICKNAFKKADSKLVLKNGKKKLYSASCAKCLTSVLLLVFPIKDGILTTIGMITDLTKDEVELIKSKKSISIDNILKLKNIINKLK